LLCASVPLQEQLSAPLGLTLPVDPLLDEAAGPEELERWYGGLPASDLVRSLARFRRLQTVSRVFGQDGLEGLPLDSQARRMLSRPAALEVEARFLSTRLAVEREAPYYGPLPVRLGEDEEDFARQLGEPDLERLALLAHELDHALAFERDRSSVTTLELGSFDSSTRLGFL